MNRRNQKLTSSFVILGLLIVGVVYAILQANLQINGIAKIQSNTWDIHFDNIQVNSNSVPIGTGDSAAIIDPNNNCKVDFEVTLSVPGDFYEFTVDVVNAGTIDGMVGEFAKTLKINNEVVSEVPDYLIYSITYEDDDQILSNHLLEAEQTISYKVRLEFSSNLEELPDAVSISSSFDAQYIQADSNAVRKPAYYACTFDGEMVQGAEYTNGQYTYRYMQEDNPIYDSSVQAYVNNWSDIDIDGWGVVLTNKASTDPVTTRVCSKINEKPLVSMKGMFTDSKTTSIDTSSFNTTQVVHMDYTFYRADSFSSIDLSYLGGDNLTSMSNFFSYQGDLRYVDMSYFNFGLVTSLSNYTFKYCQTEYLDLNHANMSHVLDMAGVFQYMSNLKTLDLSYADIRNAKSFQGFARDNSNLETLNMSYARTDSLESFYYAFKDSQKLKNIDFTGISLDNLKNVYYMFYRNNELTSIDLSMFHTPKLENMQYFVYSCSNLEEVNVSNWGSDYLSQTSNMFSDVPKLKRLIMDNYNFGVSYGSSMFYASNLEELSLRYATIENTTNPSKFLNNTAYYFNKLKKIDMTGFVFGSSMNYFFSAYSSYTDLEELILSGSDTSHVTDMSYVFYYFPNLSIDLSSWDTSHVTNMYDAFYYSNLSTLNISSWNVSNVTTMSYMFYYCTNLTGINISSWDVSNVTSMSNMFGYCTSLTSISLSGWVLASNIYLYGMFENSGITSINLGNIDTSRVTNLSGWFYNSSSLTSIDIGNINTSNVTNMSSLFSGCSSLTSLDLSSFDTTAVTNTDNMFNGCTSLTTGYARTQADADILNATSNKPSGLTFVVKP